MNKPKRENFFGKFLINKINNNYFCIILKKTFECNFSLVSDSFPITLCNKFLNNHLFVETFFLVLHAFNFELWHLNISKLKDELVYEQSELNNNTIQMLNSQSNIIKINKHLIYKKKNSKNCVFVINKIENDFISLKNSTELLINRNQTNKNYIKKNKIISKKFFEEKKIHLKNIQEKKNFIETNLENKTVYNQLHLNINGKKLIIELSKISFENFIKILRINLYDILFFDEVKFGRIVTAYDENSLTVLDINNLTKKLNIDSLFFFYKIEKNKIKFNTTFDYNGNMLFIGKKVKIISGVHKNYNVIIKYIQLNYLFVVSNNFFFNNGITCVKSEMVNVLNE
jgi:hypothetical protein